MVRRVPEVGNLLGIANGRSIVVPQNGCMAYLLPKRRRDVDEVDARIAACGTDELLRIGVLDFLGSTKKMTDRSNNT